MPPAVGCIAWLGLSRVAKLVRRPRIYFRSCEDEGSRAIRGNRREPIDEPKVVLNRLPMHRLRGGDSMSNRPSQLNKLIKASDILCGRNVMPAPAN